MGRMYARDWRGRFASTGGGGGRGGAVNVRGRGARSRSNEPMGLYRANKKSYRSATPGELKKVVNSAGNGTLQFVPIKGQKGAAFISDSGLKGASRAARKESRSGAKAISKGGGPASPGYIMTNI